jgi:hypothetical protein
VPLAEIRDTVVSSRSERGASSSVVATIEGLTMQGQWAQDCDIAVVGGGLVSSAIAWGLASIFVNFWDTERTQIRPPQMARQAVCLIY